MKKATRGLYLGDKCWIKVSCKGQPEGVYRFSVSVRHKLPLGLSIWERLPEDLWFDKLEDVEEAVRGIAKAIWNKSDYSKLEWRD